MTEITVGKRRVKKASVWVISPFSDPSSPESSDRFRYVCQELSDRGASVCQFISSFNHALRRRQRVGTLAWRCVEVFEPGYARNVSIRRVLSHVVFDHVIILYFIREVFRSGVPDTIFSALPHNGAACVAALFAKTFRARFIIDIHDTWPESILSVAKLNFLTRIAYRLWKACADFSLLCADDVFGESVRYAERANTVRDRFGRSRAQAIYLGGDLAYYQGIQPAETLPDTIQQADFIVAYAGTLGENYDLDCVINTFAAFEKECPGAGLILLGGGERESSLRSRISALRLRAWVSGRISHRVLLGYLKRSRVGLNCFKGGGNVAYSYKLNDYLLSGVPVINSLTGETASIVSGHDLGVNYVAGDPSSLLKALRACRSRWSRDPAWAEQITAFSRQFLDRRNNYRALIQRCLYGTLSPATPSLAQWVKNNTDCSQAEQGRK